MSPTISAAAEVKVPDLWVRQLCVPRSKPGKRGVHHTRRHYAELYARTGAIHDAFSRQFAAFNQDGEDNKALFAKIGKLTLPVLAIGGDHSYGASMKTEFGYVASNVEGAVIENSGHWIMEEQPQQAIRAIVAFIEKQ